MLCHKRKAGRQAWLAALLPMRAYLGTQSCLFCRKFAFKDSVQFIDHTMGNFTPAWLGVESRCCVFGPLALSLFNYALCAGKIVLRLASPRFACLKVVATLCIIQGSDRRLLRLFYYGILPPPHATHHLPHFTHDQACLGLHATFSCGFHCILQGCARRLIYMPNGACNTLPFSLLFFCFSSVAATYSITQLQQRQLLLLLLWHITLINKPLKVAIKLGLQMKTFFDLCPDILKGRQHVYTPYIYYIYIINIVDYSCVTFVEVERAYAKIYGHNVCIGPTMRRVSSHRVCGANICYH